LHHIHDLIKKGVQKIFFEYLKSYIALRLINYCVSLTKNIVEKSIDFTHTVTKLYYLFFWFNEILERDLFDIFKIVFYITFIFCLTKCLKVIYFRFSK